MKFIAKFSIVFQTIVVENFWYLIICTYDFFFFVNFKTNMYMDRFEFAKKVEETS